MYKLLKYGSKYLPFLVVLIAKIHSFFRVRIKRTNSIVSINTHDQGGGAAKIAFLINSRSNYSPSIHFFVQQKRTSQSSIFEIPEIKQSRFIAWLNEMERIGGWLDIAQLNPLTLFKNKIFQKASIIHLHNLHGYYFSYAILPTLLKHKKVIWTLHDEQLLTGHCSCTLQCDRWKKGCGNCPHLTTYPAVKIDNTEQLLAYKTKWLKEINPSIVCPSNWLASRVKEAFPFLTSVTVIPNGVNLDIFQPMDKREIRHQLNLPGNAFLILFAAELSTANPFKGGEIINELLKEGLGEDVYILTIGGDSVQQSERHLPYGYIKDEETMAKLYASSDILLYPTRADNLPLVVLEAMSCGLPVIASNVGGIAEIVEDQVNGFLVDEYFTAQKFKEGIEKYRSKSIQNQLEMGRLARKKVESSFDMKKMIQAYDRLYLDLLPSLKNDKNV